MKFSIVGGFLVCLFLAVFDANGVTVSKAISFHTVKGMRNHLYFIQNYSKNTVWLVHERKNPGAGAGWTSQIDPQRWTAIWVTKKDFQFRCHLLNNAGRNLVVSCQRYVHVVPVCTDKIPMAANSGSFWVAENLEKKPLLQRIYIRGFIVCHSSR